MENKDILNLLNSMTLEEKVGQLTQITGEHYVGIIDEEMVETGPDYSDMLGTSLYTIGSVIGSSSAKVTNLIQSEYLKKSRLKIPLLFMHDAIHGYKTIFPIPLALSCTWDKNILHKVGDYTATELRCAGINVNFSPMTDLVRDARWGRIIESFGEDHILSGNLGAAMIEGYQKETEGKIDKTGVAACLKHFAAYGAAIGGKDYNAVDMSMREFFDYYGKTYELALQGNPRFVMSSFNAFNGIPITANEEMLKEILRDKYKFKGIVISDWGAVAELQNHRVAKDGCESAKLALKAGIDIEMVSTLYLENYKKITEENPQLIENIDKSVLKILELKNELGLFENPYVDEETEKDIILNPQFLSFAKETAKRSCVLLKNDGTLPIAKDKKKILIVGEFATTKELLGNWQCKGSFDDVITLPKGMELLDEGLEIFAYESLELCPKSELKNCDHIVVTIGESWTRSGEGHSSVNIELDTAQIKLISDVKKTNKPYSCICFSGRPLALQNIIADIPSLLWCWYPGTQAGSAIAELLVGKDTPAGKLTMSFPRYSAQAPIYYNEYSSGRPANDDSYSSYSCRYQDCQVGALFKFGHGLTYTNSKYSDFSISNQKITKEQSITISFKIQNPSQYDYSDIVILYIQDVISKAVRPTHEMKKYKLVTVPAYQTVSVDIKLCLEDLYYLDAKLKSSIEQGEFKIFINDLEKPIFTIEY